MSDARYVIGIDLGTTHTALAYVDTHAAPGDSSAAVQLLPIVQTVAPGVVEARELLPSFVYLAAGHELAAGALDLPWATGRDYTVGWLARDQGASVPHRLVASAKSWLCHPGVDRTAPILPWGAPDDEVAKISPLDATVKHLEHLRDAWNAALAADDASLRLEHQDVLLTVPASFDAVARELTMTAARRAGLSSVTLLEEPQAAFYAWLARHGDGWRQQLKVGDLVLVCDVGGGTTDFTLIAVESQQGDLALERVAVGEHILLGGDNMDLALALTVAGRLEGAGQRLDPWQTRALWYACRQAKEQLLADPALASAAVTILGRGSKVIGGSIKAALTRDDVGGALVDGFFPRCRADERPARGRRGGLQELGLPYANDAAITRHLARFLGEQGRGGAVLPTALLFNGGVMKAAPLRQRVIDVVNDWLGAAQRPALQELPSDSLDLAVAHGAAYYGLVRRGRGIRIRGGVARSYYIGIESAVPAVPGLAAPLKALCVVPFGMEEGTDASIEGQQFGMIVGEPVEFRFLSSTRRKDDALGALLDRWGEEEIEELVPVHTAMDDNRDPPGTTIPVKLHSRVTEVGTLELSLHAADERSWRLEYEVREQTA